MKPLIGFIRLFSLYFPDPPIMNPGSGYPRQPRVVPEGLRKRQRDLRREWRRRESTPGADQAALRAEYIASVS
jgi:hypothetical protein